MRQKLAHVALGILLVAAFSPAAATRQPSILAQARQAIGGEARLNAVKALSVKGITRNDDEASIGFLNLQLDFLFPDWFLISRERAYFRRVGGFNWKELIERRWTDSQLADLRPADVNGEAYAWQLAARRRECAIYLVSWLLGPPPEYGVQFTDVPAGEQTDLKWDVVDAKGANELAMRLYFDKTTHRLSKLTYRNPVATTTPFAAPTPALPPDAAPPVFNSLEAKDVKVGEVTMEFSEHHADDGIVFPHRIRIEAEGLRERWEFSRFRVNPPLDANYFLRKFF